MQGGFKKWVFVLILLGCFGFAPNCIAEVFFIPSFFAPPLPQNNWGGMQSDDGGFYQAIPNPYTGGVILLRFPREFRNPYHPQYAGIIAAPAFVPEPLNTDLCRGPFTGNEEEFQNWQAACLHSLIKNQVKESHTEEDVPPPKPITTPQPSPIIESFGTCVGSAEYCNGRPPLIVPLRTPGTPCTPTKDNARYCFDPFAGSAHYLDPSVYSWTVGEDGLSCNCKLLR